MTSWLLVSLVLLLLIAQVAPQQLPVALYKLALITLAGVVGYHLDRSLFPYARPDGYLATGCWQTHLWRHGKSAMDADLPIADGYGLVFAAAMLRRAIVVAACIIGVAMGL
ncbi:putative holin [Chitinivorax sp. PXF-14]|uniref:putative holin n=1 Tax=Chitinivorax sp. PXF-14 TaxID=3230488 RepID=UPI00346754B3